MRDMRVKRDQWAHSQLMGYGPTRRRQAIIISLIFNRVNSPLGEWVCFYCIFVSIRVNKQFALKYFHINTQVTIRNLLLQEMIYCYLLHEYFLSKSVYKIMYEMNIVKEKVFVRVTLN